MSDVNEADTSAEHVTPALERAEAAVRAAMIEHGPDGHIDGDKEITRAALDAALDVDEIARALDRHQYDGNGYCTCGALLEYDTDGVVMEVYESRHYAAAIRAALLGGSDE